MTKIHDYIKPLITTCAAGAGINSQNQPDTIPEMPINPLSSATECEKCRYHDADRFDENLGRLCSRCHEWFAKGSIPISIEHRFDYSELSEREQDDRDLNAAFVSANEQSPSVNNCSNAGEDGEDDLFDFRWMDCELCDSPLAERYDPVFRWLCISCQKDFCGERIYVPIEIKSKYPVLFGFILICLHSSKIYPVRLQ